MRPRMAMSCFSGSVFKKSLFFVFLTIFSLPAFAQTPLPNDLQIYCLNVRAFFKEKEFQTFDDFSNEEIRKIADLGFNTVWLLGVWAESELSRRFQDSREDLPKSGRRMASAYAIPEYRISSQLGGEKSFKKFVSRAKHCGIKIILDITPNSLAADSPLVLQHPSWFIQKEQPLWQNEKLYFFQMAIPPHGEKVWFAHPKYFKKVIPDLVQIDLLSGEAWQFIERSFLEIARLTQGGGARIDYLTDFQPETYRSVWYPKMKQEDFYSKLDEISLKVFGAKPLIRGQIFEIILERLKKEYPDFITLGEVYRGQHGEWQRVGIDLTYTKYIYDWLVLGRDLNLWNAILDLARMKEFPLLSNDEGWLEFKRYVLRQKPHEKTSPEYFFRSLYFCETHDEQKRLLRLVSDRLKRKTVGAEAVEASKLLFTALATIPGVPMVYMGQEEGRSEDAPTAVWMSEEKEAPREEIAVFYKNLLNKTKQPVFRRGALREISIKSSTDKNAILAFARTYETQSAIVVLNHSPKPSQVQLDLGSAGLERKLLDLTLPPWGTYLSMSSEASRAKAPSLQARQIRP